MAFPTHLNKKAVSILQKEIDGILFFANTWLYLVYFPDSCFIVNIAAIQEQRNASAAGIGSTIAESSPAFCASYKDKLVDNCGPLGLNFQQVSFEGESCLGTSRPFRHGDFHIENGVETAPSVEHQFIPSFTSRSPVIQSNQEENPISKNVLALRSGSDEEISVSLQLGEPEPKRRKNCNSFFSTKGPK